MITINLTDISQVSKIANEINDALLKKEFKEFLLKKCQNELDDIIKSKLNDVEYEIAEKYPSGNKTEIGDDYIELYNDSMVDLSDLSEKTAMNYANGLSMAKLVEYGTGIVGQQSEAAKFAEDWEYDVNNHGNKGWYYERDGMVYWSRGMEGKLIYNTLQTRVEDKIGSWVEEYLKNEIGK